MGYMIDKAVATCREEGGSLPLPKNDEENEDFKLVGGGLIDATDFDGDGVWHDSYGNVVTYLAPLKQPINPESFDSYPYLNAIMSPRLGQWYFVWGMIPVVAHPKVFCQIPIASSDPPVEGENLSFFW